MCKKSHEVLKKVATVPNCGNSGCKFCRLHFGEVAQKIGRIFAISCELLKKVATVGPQWEQWEPLGAPRFPTVNGTPPLGGAQLWEWPPSSAGVRWRVKW